MGRGALSKRRRASTSGLERSAHPRPSHRRASLPITVRALVLTTSTVRETDVAADPLALVPAVQARSAIPPMCARAPGRRRFTAAGALVLRIKGRETAVALRLLAHLRSNMDVNEAACFSLSNERRRPGAEARPLSTWEFAPSSGRRRWLRLSHSQNGGAYDTACKQGPGGSHRFSHAQNCDGAGDLKRRIHRFGLLVCSVSEDSRRWVETAVHVGRDRRARKGARLIERRRRDEGEEHPSIRVLLRRLQFSALDTELGCAQTLALARLRVEAIAAAARAQGREDVAIELIALSGKLHAAISMDADPAELGLLISEHTKRALSALG
jgi:hypothetical protein